MSNTERRKQHRNKLVRLQLRHLCLALSIFTPILFFLVVGAHAWWGLENKWIYLLALTLFSTGSGLAYKYLISPQPAKTDHNFEEFEPTNQTAWGPQEEQIWEEAKAEANRRIEMAPEIIDVVQHHPIALADFISSKYNGRKKLDINPLEALVLVEEVSRRYRLLLRERFPFVEQISLHRADQAFRFANSDLAQTAKKYAPWVLHAYEALTNPAGKVVKTVLGDVREELLDQSIQALQLRLKRLFLFECIEVLMDLYSGRFLITDDQLSESFESVEDKNSMGEVLEPLRISVIGQVSSGKSTLVNRLCGEVVAEVDILPTTDKNTVYEIGLKSGIQVRLCDLPGLDNDSRTADELFLEIIKSDLVIWCLRANQSAKSLDQKLSIRLEEYFADPKNVAFKPPKILGVVTHIDAVIGSGKPGNLESAEIIGQVIDFNVSLVSLDAIEPLDLFENSGLEKIQSLIEIFLEDALQVQLNRRRAASTQSKFAVQIDRFKKGSSGLLGLFK